ncbi:MAG: hypothetical protein KA974_11105 [Saprospiraceae bacterium]|nr:hypothetical protein [Saprospiraceae bacterium]MBP7679427.1 hypothetical protein [Saprospiraceae bacterium]
MKNLILVVCCLLLSMGSISAQRENTLIGDSGLRFSGIWGGSSLGMSKFDDDYAFTKNGFFALEFGKALSVGWVGYKTEEKIPIGNDISGLNNSFSMDYNGLLLSYAHRANKTIHPTVSLVTGGGRIDLEGEKRDRVFVIQPSIGFEINLVRWCHVGIEGGYNFVTNTDFANYGDGDFSAPYAAVTFKFGWSWGKSFGNYSNNRNTPSAPIIIEE